MLNALGVTLVPMATLHASEQAARSLLTALADYAARSSVILLLAWVVAALLWRRASATRYAVWAVAITMVAVLPLLSRVTPSIVVSLPTIAPAMVDVGSAKLGPAPAPVAVQPVRSYSSGARAVNAESRGVPVSAVAAHQDRA